MQCAYYVTIYSHNTLTYLSINSLKKKMHKLIKKETQHHIAENSVTQISLLNIKSVFIFLCLHISFEYTQQE